MPATRKISSSPIFSFSLSQMFAARVSIQIGVLASTRPSLSTGMADQLCPSIPIPAMSCGSIPFSVSIRLQARQTALYQSSGSCSAHPSSG